MQLVTTSLAEQMRKILRDRIVSGALPPNSRLDLESLAAEFSVSVTPVRDAVRLLERDGLVVVQARKGVFTAAADVKAFRDVFDTRIALECLAVETAAHGIPTVALDELQGAYDEAAERLAGAGVDEEAILGPIDGTLHDLIVRHCANAVVRELMESLRSRTAWVRRVAADSARRYRLSFDEHRRVLAALRRRDATGAARELREHLTRSRDHTLAAMAGPDVAGAPDGVPAAGAPADGAAPRRSGLVS